MVVKHETNRKRCDVYGEPAETDGIEGSVGGVEVWQAELYGSERHLCEKIHKTFRISRQGVRWRFQRLFNHVYVEAFETILMIENIFGTQLREYAVRISKERWSLRNEAQNSEFQSAADVSRK